MVGYFVVMCVYRSYVFLCCVCILFIACFEEHSKVLLRGMLQTPQRTTLLDEGIDSSKLDQLENEVNYALVLMERDFPADIQVK